MTDSYEFSIDVGSHRSRIIRTFLSKLDEVTSADGFVRPLHEEIHAVDEDHNGGTDTSEQPTSDQSGTDDGLPDGSPEDKGPSDPRPVGLRESTDEGTAEGADRAQVATSEPSERETTDERDEPESDKGESEQGYARSVFGAFQHI